MIITKCPSCSNEVKAPDSFLGKKIRCKSDTCKHVFVVSQSAIPAESDSFATLTPVDDDGLANISMDEMALETPRRTKSGSKKTKSAKGSYPNLLKYLRWTKLAALVQLTAVAVVCFCLLVIPLINAVTQNYSFKVAVSQIFGGITTSLVVGIAGYMIFIFTLAGIEFVHVIIDIEANTRSLRSQSDED